MPRFDRYLLSQLLSLFGFFALVLVAVYWVNRAVGLFDQLIGDGQSAIVFLEFSILTLPNVIRLVLPIAAFAATVYVTNRLMQESELVVMQATGFSAFRLARPVLYFGLIVAVMAALLAHVLVPASRSTLSLRTAEISQSVTARFLNDGQFMHPAAGITLYIREISPNGELRDIFLSDERNAVRHSVYTATRALLVRGDAEPKLIMIDGMMQTLTPEGRRLALTRFADFTYDIGALITGRDRLGRTLDEMSTVELLSPTPALLEEARESRAAFLYEGHTRMAQPFLSTAAAMVGFSALMLGTFSRFGLWRQVGIAVVLLIVVQTINTQATAIGLRDERGWPLAYLAPLVGLAISAGLLAWSQRPRRVRGPAAEGAA